VSEGLYFGSYYDHIRGSSKWILPTVWVDPEIASAEKVRFSWIFIGFAQIHIGSKQIF